MLALLQRTLFFELLKKLLEIIVIDSQIDIR
jgi:hypothetical protein